MSTPWQVDVKAIKRVVIFRYDAETQMISFRHYEICTKAVGLSKGVKSLMKVRVPDLSAFSDIKDFVVKYGCIRLCACVSVLQRGRVRERWRRQGTRRTG
jgi:hypothetical protein